ncbi:MAG: DUF1080 domain-containing protein [Pyrinomonadaceae bacterium]|nr:DUF1080 domain-containing protein [Phycisphaerales bacterium]
MKLSPAFVVQSCVVLAAAMPVSADVKVAAELSEKAGPEFKFANVPSPSKYDAATRARFTIVDGRRDGNGSDLGVLHDGKLPKDQDQPGANVFFAGGTDGGRLTIDLGKAIDIKQVNTYSWHPGARGPQVYKLYASDGTTKDFLAAPKRDAKPEQCGWKHVADVDTRIKQGQTGGQYGVSIEESAGSLGTYQYLLLDISRTESDDSFSNTFYSEIDVIAAAGPKDGPTTPVVVQSADGTFEITLDTGEAPELRDWADVVLTPVMLEWYPKIREMLASDGFTAPAKFSVTFRNPGRGVAATSGTRIICAAPWYVKNLEGEAVGSIVHELVHVVQQYGAARRANPDATQTPGWLTEGIADYIRWYLYEPQSHWADRIRNPENAAFDKSYRVSANFLNWVTEKHDKAIVKKLNAAIREGKYDADIWKQCTGKTVEELGKQWKDGLIADAAAEALAEASKNTLTDAEKQAGWKLLFNGKDFTGWHSFKRQDVMPGWQIKDGVIICADPHNAGDLCTNEMYGAFELSLEYNIEPGGNSGIMFHVTDAGGATWATGPECQLLDNKEGKDPQRSGWLYGLYKTDVDATKPAGEWNRLRLLISPQKCEHEMNGVKYFEYVMRSDDFKQRLAKSKFGTMKDFAKFDTGYISFQGDHGSISFRNVKIREVGVK